MTLLMHELKKGRVALIIWTASIAFMLVVSVLMFPDMKLQADEMNEAFSSMGDFTKAFGMESISIADMEGFYGTECGNTLGIGGGFFAALLGIAALANEEKNKTAEFLLTHPIKRSRVVTEKLLAVIIQLVILNAATFLCSLATIYVIGEKADIGVILMLHAASLVTQLEVAAICFGISAFLRKGGLGIGIGFAFSMYFINILSNLSDNMKFLKYISPFGYADAAPIINGTGFDWVMVAIGVAIAAVFIVIAFVKYNKKDIAA